MSSPAFSNPWGFLQPSSLWGRYNNLRFMIQQMLSKVQTATIVQVTACSNDGGVSPVGTVDVQILVNQMGSLAGQMVGVPHVTMLGLPYLRVQGGANAIIIDPQVGDIGIAVFASRDITNVKSTKAQANPGSFRTHDFADGMYLGGLLNGVPLQFIQFSTAGIVVSVPPVATATIQTGDELSSVIVDDDSVTMDSSDVDITAEIGEIDLTGEVYTDQNLHVGSGATGTFSTSTGQTVTVQDGIVIDLGREMNTAYFNSTIHELNQAATYLNKYSAYVNAEIASIESQPIPNGATSLPGYASPCGQLALLAVQLIEKIDNVSTKTTKNINKATADISTMQANIRAQISTLEGLMIVPTDLPSVLTWINKIINTFAGPYTTYTGQQVTLVAQEALLAAAVTRLATAITNASTTLTGAISDAQSRLGCVI